MGKYDQATPAELNAGRKALMGGGVGGSLPLVVDHGNGACLYDKNGKEYIDCTSQAWTLTIGYSHPTVTAAVKGFVGQYTHIRTSFDTVPKLLLAKRLSDLAPKGLDLVTFCLHGSNAIEGAMKLAMRKHPERKNFLSFFDGYHGRTLATMAAGWPHPNNAFLQFTGNFVRVPQAYCYRCKFGKEYPSCNLQCAKFIEETIKHGMDGLPAGLIMEPMQGNGGMIDYPKPFYKAVRELCDKYDIALIWDEMQCAFGRIGGMFSSEIYGVIPDIIVFGKAIGGGYPLAGTICGEKYKFATGDHSFTFSHFPVSMVAALATLDVIEEENIIAQCLEKGEYIKKKLLEMQPKYEIMGEVRAQGLMIAIEMVKDRKTKELMAHETHEMIEEALQDGLILGGCKYLDLASVLKIKPPAVITYEQIDTVLKKFEKLVAKWQDKILRGKK